MVKMLCVSVMIKKITNYSPNRDQLQYLLNMEVSLCEPLSLPCGDFVWLDLVPS